MSLLQENVYFSYRKVNKNAYFTLFEVNKNVNLVIFNMSKITCGSSFKLFYFSTKLVEPFLSLSGGFAFMLVGYTRRISAEN